MTINLGALLASPALNIRNATGVTLVAGDLIYVSSWDETYTRFLVSKADADVAGARATHIMRESLATATNGTAYRTYRLTGQATNGLTVGDPIYLNTTAGGWVAVAPTGADDVNQVVGRVTVVHASTGEIEFDLTHVLLSKIGSNELQTGSILTGAILDATITADDLATSAVATAEILDGTIITGDIATGGVETADILDGTITVDDIATSGVATAEILDGTILPGDLSANLKLGHIDLDIFSMKILSGGTIQATIEGFVADSNTDPSLARINGATDPAIVVTWAANSVVVTQFPPVAKPADFDEASVAVVKLRMAKGSNTDTAAVLGVGFFEDIGDTNAGGNTEALSVSTLATYTVTISASNLAAPPGVWTLTLTPGTHANDSFLLYGAWIEYTRRA